LGWFTGKTSDLNPDGPIVRAQNLIRLGGGSKKVFESAQVAYFEQKYQWSLELTEALSLYSEDLNVSQIIELEVLSLQKLASIQTSANGRNWYLTKSLEIQGLIDIKPPPAQVVQSILESPLNNSFMLLPVNLNYKKVNGINQLVLFHFNDTDQKFSVHIRNEIADIKYKWPQDFQSDSIDMIIEVIKEQVWKQVMARIKSPNMAISNREIIVKYGNGQINLAGQIQLINFLDMFI
jgi:alkyl sulfatase BDS1-like metallo-beta-lactamase superfamily hydrolase